MGRFSRGVARVGLPAGVTIVEVGPRDGLQNLRQVLPTPDKVRYIGLLAASGLAAIEVTSFVSPTAVPQLADAAETVAGIRDLPITPIALVPNLQGARRAVAAIVALAGEAPDLTVRASLATAFGCPFEGRVPLAEVVRWVGAVAEVGIREVGLADTVGYGNPEQVRQTLLACQERHPNLTYGVHFHDTRGMGIANALAALQGGVTVLDAASGGLGGCPFAPGATGNVATEDLVYLCEEMGVKTGVDLARLCEASRFLQTILPDVDLPGRVLKAGPPRPCGPILS